MQSFTILYNVLTMDNILRKQFSEIETYIPGRPIERVQEEYGLEKVIKLASNESSLGPMRAAIEAIRSNIEQLNRYPDIEATFLRQALSEFYEIAPENILIGNGSNELLRIAGQAVINPGDEVVYAEPSFVLYKMIADLFEAKPVAVPLKDHKHDLEAMLAAVTPRTKLVFICNPNNPTGTIVGKKELEDFISQVPDNVLIVIDEAYAEFVEDKNNYRQNLKDLPDRPIIITRTFSKLFGLAGLRMGYGVADASYVTVDKKIRDPFNVNLLGQAAATSSLASEDEIKKRYLLNLEDKHYLYEGLASLNLKYIESEANFVLIDVGQDSTVIFEKLLQKGVIVRTGEIFGESYRNFIRVSVGTREEIDFFLSALKNVLL